MNRYFYDLHVHSCLSPCGDDDMTPANIAGMAVIKLATPCHIRGMPLTLGASWCLPSCRIYILRAKEI